jgi:hypothetical protein
MLFVKFDENVLTGVFTVVFAAVVVVDDVVVPLVQDCPVQVIVTSVSVALTWAPSIIASDALSGASVVVTGVLPELGVGPPAVYASGSVGVAEAPVPADAFVPGEAPVQPHAPTSITTKRHAIIPGLYIF